MKIEKQRQPWKKQKSFGCFVMMLLLVLSLIPANGTAFDERVIRVGYDSNSHFIKENSEIGRAHV